MHWDESNRHVHNRKTQFEYETKCKLFGLLQKLLPLIVIFQLSLTFLTHGVTPLFLFGSRHFYSLITLSLQLMCEGRTHCVHTLIHIYGQFRADN